MQKRRNASSRACLSSLVCSIAVLAFFAPNAGCQGCENPRPPRREIYRDPELNAQVFEVAEDDDPAPQPAILAAPPDGDRFIDEAPVLPASVADPRTSDEAIVANRYVYRVRQALPAGLGSRRVKLALPAAELFIDVSHDRLRATFVGDAWPMPPGAEVRLRRDRPGVYVFDSRGGRPLAPGELASWFEAGRVSRHGPPLRVFGDYGRRREILTDEESPGELICAFMAEWAGESRELVMRRCERGAPTLFRLGFWRGDRTAHVPMQLHHDALRADEESSPEMGPRARAGTLLEPHVLALISPTGRSHAEARAHAEVDAPPPVERGLRLMNDTPNRLILAVEGVPFGWIDPGVTNVFEGLRPGLYEIGAIRPLGAVVQRARAVRVPGVHRFCDGRCGRRGPTGVPP